MPTVGGTVSVDLQGGATLGNGVILIRDGLLATGQRATSHPSNPTGITGATGAAVMLGLAAVVTPNAAGNELVLIQGDIITSVIGDGATLQISYGTGSAPANNAALAGTLVGQAQTFIASTAAGRQPFLLHAYITGLTAGTTYWIDLAVQNLTGGTTTIAAVQVTSVEV